MEKDQVSDTQLTKASAMDGLKQACKDVRTWLFVFMQCFHLSACSFNSFFPTYVTTPHHAGPRQGWRAPY